MRKIIMASITAVVVIAVLAGTLIPVLDDATEQQRTFTNEGYYNMSHITSDTDIVLTWDYTTPNVITVGDVDVSLANLPIGTAFTILGTDEVIVRYTATASNTTLSVHTSVGYMDASVTAGTNLTVTLSGYDITLTNGTVTRNVTITDGYYLDSNGSYTMKKPTESAYLLKSEDIIILAGITYLGGSTVTNAGVYGTGTVDNGLDLEFVQINTMATTPTITFGDVTFNYTDVSGYDDLVQLTDCKFTISEDDVTVTATYSYFLVPTEVTAEKSVHFTDGENAILNAIPVIVIIALLLAVVAIVLRSRMD